MTGVFNTAALAAALGGRRCRHGWMVRCPAHDDRTPSLSIGDGKDGRLLVHCFAGCEQREVVRALRNLDLLGSPESPRPLIASASHTTCEHSSIAQDMWRSCRPAKGSVVEVYLRHRGIVGANPPTIGFLSSARHSPTDTRWPCMVAAVARWPSHSIAGVHRTYLRYDGHGKAPVDPPRMSLGSLQGGAVRLATPTDRLLVAEGIETALACMMATGLPAWSTLSAGGLETVVLPTDVRTVIVCTDYDNSGRGQQAAQKLALRLLREGRRVRIALPPDIDTDWADLVHEALHAHAA